VLVSVLPESIGWIPPVEFEAAYWRSQAAEAEDGAGTHVTESPVKPGGFSLSKRQSTIIIAKRDHTMCMYIG